MKRVLSLGAAAVIIAGAMLAAQAAPSFAGKWTLVPDPNAAPAVGPGGPWQSALIVQDAATLTITRQILRMPRGLTGPEDYVTYATVGAVPRHRGPVLAVVRGRGGC